MAPTPETLAALLSVHRPEDPLGSTCVHAPSLNYGTRSSMLLFLSKEWTSTRLLWAEGSPCKTPYVEQNHLLAGLTQQGL
jgi:hypothetical protein